MPQQDLNDIFTKDVLEDLLPSHLSNDFFEALYGDAAEGAYDINLSFKDYDSEQKKLFFELQLHERPGKCLACNLTYGLPEVFSCHPLLNIKGMVEKIESLLGGEIKCSGWELGTTQTPAASMHAIPLTIHLE
ncbi:pancreas/duodenum homeobox protein 1 [Thermodesulfobacteriota bacterium]